MATAEERRRAHATDEWRRALYEQSPEREALFSTMSGLENEPLYTPSNVAIDYDRDLGYPGAFPYTRGVHPSMYRGRLWTMRQFAGFGTAEETNARFHYLLDHGQTGLSTAFDMPTLMGYDSDHPSRSARSGARASPIDSLDDMEQLFAGIPLGEVSTSMTINAPAAMLLAFYICVAEEQGVPQDQLRGTIQNDILKEYIAQKEWIFPPEPSMRLCVDMIEYCARARAALAPGLDLRLPHPRGRARPPPRSSPSRSPTASPTWRPAIERGLDVDDFAPRLSFFFNAHNDFFEEVAKYRAARRIWAQRAARALRRQEPALVAACASTRRPPASRSPRSSPR